MRTTTATTIAFPLLLGISWGEWGVSITMTSTLTAIDVKFDCPVGSKDEQEIIANAHRKKVHDLEYDLRQLKAENKQLKEKLYCSKKKYRCSSKEDIRTYNEWTFDKANLANKINNFSRDVMFLPYKFLKEGWQDYAPSTRKSLSILWGKRWLIHTKI
jgi:hypothetical protein